MHRDYDEEEYRDDELYHYGKTGMKWGHHIYAMVKATAKKAARSASKNLKAGGKFLKENPEFAYGVALPAAAAGVGIAAVGSVLGYAGSKIAQKRRLKIDKNTIDTVERRYKRGEIDDVE